MDEILILLDKTLLFLKNNLTKRNIIYSGLMLIACYIVAKMGINFSKNLEMVIFLVAFFVILEMLSQYLLYSAKCDKLAGKKGQAVIKQIFFYAYILIFSIPGAVGIFNSELSKTIQSGNTINTDRIRIENTISNNNMTISTLQLSLQYEAKTGYGKASENILSHISSLETENKNLSESLKELPKEVFNIEKSWFEPIANLLNIIPLLHLTPENIKLIMFYFAVLMLQYGLIVFNPDPKKNEDQKENDKIELTPEVKKSLPDISRESTLNFIDKMYRENSNALNGFAYICENAKLNLQEAEKIRDFLYNLNYKGQALIDSRQGGSRALTHKENLVKVVSLYMGWK